MKYYVLNFAISGQDGIHYLFIYCFFARDTENLVGPEGDEFQYVSWSPSGESMVGSVSGFIKLHKFCYTYSKIVII